MTRALASLLALATACSSPALLTRVEHARPMQAVRLAALANVRHELGEGHHAYNLLRRLLLQRGVTSEALAKLTADTPENARAWAEFFDWAHANPDEAKRTLELVAQLARTRGQWRLYADSGHNDGTQAKYVIATALVVAVVAYVVITVASGKEPSLPGLRHHPSADYPDRMQANGQAAVTSALVASTQSQRRPARVETPLVPAGGGPSATTDSSAVAAAQRESAEEAEQQRKRAERAERKRQCLAGIDACTYGEGITACRPPEFTNEWPSRAQAVSAAILVLHLCKNDGWETCRKEVMEALPSQDVLVGWGEQARQIGYDFNKADYEFVKDCSATPGNTETVSFLNLKGLGDCANAENCERELKKAADDLERWGHAHECTWNATYYTHRKKLHDDKIRECNQLYGDDD